MTENEIGEIIVDCAVKVPMRLGPGLLESVYEMVLCYELQCLSGRKVGYLLNFGEALMTVFFDTQIRFIYPLHMGFRFSECVTRASG